MDFKSTCIFIAFISIACGIVMGWKEFQEEKSGHKAPAGIAGRKPPENGDREPVIPSRETEIREPEPVEAPRQEPVTPPVKVPDPIDLSISSADEAELEKISGLIDAHKLPDASRAARQLVENKGGMLREKARQLEARIRILQKLEPREVGKAPVLKKVVHANKSEHICTSVQESFESYRLNLISGGVTSIRKQDVLAVRTIPSREGKKMLLGRLDKRVKGLKDPLDFYLRGVRKYYRLGLVDEGYELLLDLVGRKDADLALSVLGEEEATDLLPYWNISQGSGVAAIERKAEARKREIASIQNSPPPTTAGNSEPANPAATTSVPRPRPPRPPPRRPEVQSPPRPTGSASKSELAAVKNLISRAGNYYTTARRDEKKRGNFKKAYETLRDAQDLLGKMPATDDVRKMRSQVATQMLDVSKSLGFFDF